MPNLLRTPEDLQWLQEVHGVPTEGAVCAVVHGNEDWPDKVEVHIKDGQPPLAYTPDKSGKYHLANPPQSKLRFACRAAMAELLRLNVGDHLDIDGKRTVVSLYEALTEAGYDVTDYAPEYEELIEELGSAETEQFLKPDGDTIKDGFRTVTWTISIPGDCYDRLDCFYDAAILQAREEAADYVTPANWYAERIHGDVGDQEVVFWVTRKSRV